MKHAALFGVAALCAVAGYVTERFGHELCHQGVPLAATALGAPLAGLAAGFASVALGPPRWMFGVNTVVAGVNLFYLVKAVKVALGVGFLSCR